jgi:ribosomal protein S27E
MAIILNAVRCKGCDEVIYSKTRHDFKFCKCGSVAVDGGTAYIKRSVKPNTEYDELSMSPDDMYALG